MKSKKSEPMGSTKIVQNGEIEPETYTPVPPKDKAPILSASVNRKQSMKKKGKWAGIVNW